LRGPLRVRSTGADPDREPGLSLYTR
jgi:hypothetical protein